jgi:hypothetical protein
VAAREARFVSNVDEQLMRKVPWRDTTASNRKPLTFADRSAGGLGVSIQ